MSTSMPASPRLKIAIACPGVGLVQRGFERFFADLFQLMRDDFDITLFKGGGRQSEREKIPLFANRNGKLVKFLPIHKLFGRTAYHSECMTYALAMIPHLRNGAFDIVHTIDAPLTRLLYRMRARLGLRFRLLYSEATGMAPSDYPPADHTLYMAPVYMERALAFGHAAETMSVIPCGVYPERFAPSQDRKQLRRNHGVDDDVFVIVSVAALNRWQKRIDYLIDEVAQLEGKWLLLLDGSLDHGDADLADYARKKLGDRVRISHVPSDKVRDLYAMADVMAHVAILEAFGIAIAEAATTGLPIITHDGEHFRWLLPNPNCWIDAHKPGALLNKLRVMMRDVSERNAMRCDSLTLQRFSWHNLRPQYGDLYRHVASLPIRTVDEAECRKAMA